MEEKDLIVLTPEIVQSRILSAPPVVNFSPAVTVGTVLFFQPPDCVRNINRRYSVHSRLVAAKDKECAVCG